MNGVELIVPSVIGDQASDTHVISYYNKKEAASIIITIQEQKCDDTMADHSFHFGVSIQVKSDVEDEFEQYQGYTPFVKSKLLVILY